MACAALIVTVSWPEAPTTTVRGEGPNATIVGGGGVTCTADSAIEPFRLTWTMAVPRARVPTGIVVLSWFAVTITEAGTKTMPAGLAVTAIVVVVGCVAEIVTVSVPLAPSVIESVGGCSDTMVAWADVTVTVLVVLCR